MKKGFRSMMKRTISIFLILFGCVGCDQATKFLADRNLPRAETFHYLSDTLRLQYTENSGAFLSMGAHIPQEWRTLLLILMVGAFLAGLLIYLLGTKHADAPTTAALSFVLGGGIGNLIDRLARHGRVIDFLNVGIGPVRTGIFNVADMAITFGTLWVLLLTLRNRKNREKLL
jgi:signal peptidase II